MRRKCVSTDTNWLLRSLPRRPKHRMPDIYSSMQGTYTGKIRVSRPNCESYNQAGRHTKDIALLSKEMVNGSECFEFFEWNSMSCDQAN
jgi:hypothetical protein